MNNEELDRCYTALCEALARQGEAQASQLLAMLSLALISRQTDAQAVLDLIAQIESKAGKLT
jgi:hypothetical protein